MKYNLAYKHAEKIAKKAESGRTVLQGVYHNENNIQSTDSRRLLKVTVDKMNFEEHILHAKDNTEIEGKFPDTDKLHDLSGYNGETIELTVEEIKAIRDIIKVAKTMKFDFIEINSQGENVVLKSTLKLRQPEQSTDNQTLALHKSTLSFELLRKKQLNDVELETTLNIDYMLDVFDFLVETKDCTTLRLHQADVRPIQFVGKDYCYVVMPIRKYR